jgi:methionyl-tRNA formyltransferase
MKIVFMGTPEFAIPSLEKLLESGYTISAVVTAPDKERGRGKQVSPSAVKEFALKSNLEVLTPSNLKDETFINQLKKMQPDLFIIVAFRILPKEVYSIAKSCAFNLHGSLLPKYRGAAPIQWSIINGEKETGVTTFYLEDKVDTGNIILQEKIEIHEDDDFGTLHDKMMILGADVVLKTVKLIESGNVPITLQDNTLASPAPKITKEICQIDWNKPAIEIHNLVRGLSPYPAAYFSYDGKSYKVFKTKIIENLEFRTLPTDRQNENSIDENSPFSILHSPLSGSILQTTKEIFVNTGNGFLQILELQLEGRKRMTTEEFLRGYKLP